MTLSTRQSEILTGLMLGDGHLSVGGRAINPRLRINRAATDIDYAKWIKDAFANYCTTNSLTLRDMYDKRHDKTYHRVSFSTRRSIDFLAHYNLWYNTTKQLPTNLTLTPLTIAIWFADDGGFYQKRKQYKDTTTTCGVEMKFATCSFGKEGSEYLAEMLNKRYGGGFKVYGGYTTAIHYRIMASTKTARKVAEDIYNVFPPMERKSKFWTDGPLQPKALVPPCKICNSNNTFKNGFYSYKTTKLQKITCNTCGCTWKSEPFLSTL